MLGVQILFLSSKYLAKVDAIHQKSEPVFAPKSHKIPPNPPTNTPNPPTNTPNQSKSTPKSHKPSQNGLGLLLKTHTLTPPRQAISLLALAANRVRTCAPHPPKQKPNRTAQRPHQIRELTWE